MTTPAFPQVEVQLTGEDGNAFAIMGRVASALRRHGVSAASIDAFRSECVSGNYDNLLRTCMAWVTVK